MIFRFLIDTSTCLIHRMPLKWVENSCSLAPRGPRLIVIDSIENNHSILATLTLSYRSITDKS